MKILKAVTVVLAVLLALKIAGELVSILFSGWFILTAVGVWWFFLREDRDVTL